MEQNAEQQTKRLYKSRQNRVIDGICGGIAEYFEVDPTIVRILWVLITLLGGSGLVLYIIAMIVMPVNPNYGQQPRAGQSSGTSSDRKRNWGIVLILIGVFIMMSNFGWFANLHWWSFSRTVVFPISLILIGLLFIYVQTQKSRGGASPPQAPEPGEAQHNAAPRPVSELRRSRTDRKVCGVCGGLAAYFNIDPTVVRILFVVMILASVGWALLLYIIMCVLVPEERLSTSTTQG